MNFLSCKISPKEYTAGEKMLVRAIKEIALKIEILEKGKNLFKVLAATAAIVRLYSIVTRINKSILDMRELEE